MTPVKVQDAMGELLTTKLLLESPEISAFLGLAAWPSERAHPDQPAGRLLGRRSLDP